MRAHSRARVCVCRVHAISFNNPIPFHFQYALRHDCEFVARKDTKLLQRSSHNEREKKKLENNCIYPKDGNCCRTRETRRRATFTTIHSVKCCRLLSSAYANSLLWNQMKISGQIHRTQSTVYMQNIVADACGVGVHSMESRKNVQ